MREEKLSVGTRNRPGMMHNPPLPMALAMAMALASLLLAAAAAADTEEAAANVSE
jgi:hypothetical protein